MKDKTKETLDRLKYIVFNEIIDYGEELSLSECKLLLDYITNLQEELDISQTNEETYRLEMLDITKILGLDEHTTFDEVKEYATNLQNENMKYDQCLTELTDNYKELQKELTNLQEENKRLRKEIELCKKNGKQ